MKKRNWFIAAAVLLPVTLISLLPVFLSSTWIQNLLLSRLNSQAPGALSFERCTIGWQQGLQCRNVSYVDVHQGVQINAQRVNSSHGLFALIVASRNLGTVTVDDPVVVLTGATSPVYHKETSSAASQNTPPPADISKATGKIAVSASDTVPFWDKVNIRLLANRTVVKLAYPKKPAETFIRNCSLDARLAAGTVDIDLDLESARGQGEVQAVGFINLPARKNALAETLVAEIKLDVQDLQIEDFLGLVPGQPKLPLGRGELTSNLSIKTAGSASLEIVGTSMLRNVVLQGGILGADQPEFKKIDITLDVQRAAGKGWQLSTLQLASDFGNLEAAGSVAGTDFTLNGKGKLDLPVLFSQLPRLLHAQPETSLEDGSMDITVKLARAQQRLEVAMAAVAEKISGNQAGHPFSWNSRIKLNLDGSMEDGEPGVGKLAFQAPFFDLTGVGDLKAFSLQGSADLGPAVEEIGKLFQFNWDGSGSLRLSAQLEEKGEKRYVVNSRMEIEDFSLTHQGKVVVPLHQLTFSGSLKTPRQLPQTRAEGMDLVFDLTSWPGRVHGKLDTVYHKGRQMSGSYELQSDLHLGRLTDLLHNFDILDRDTTLTGSMDLQASGYSEENRLIVRELDSRVHDLLFYRNGKIIKDSLLHVFTRKPSAGGDAARPMRELDLADNETVFFMRGGGRTMVDAVNRRFVLRNLAINSDLGSLDIGLADVEDWQQFPAALLLQLKGAADLAELTPVLQQFELLPAAQTLGGKGSFATDLAPGKDGEHTGFVKIDLKNGYVSRDGKKSRPAGQQLQFSSRLQGDLTTGDIDFETFDLQSLPLSLKAGGRLQRSGTDPYFSLAGDVTPDFSALASLLNGLYATDVRAAGGQQKKFRFRLPLAAASGADKYQKLQFAADLHAAYVSHFGIDLQEPNLQVSMEKGVLKTQLSGKLNNGRLQLSPSLDYTLSPPVVTLPEAEQVLTDVQLEQALVDGLLKRINPVLGLLATPAGTVSARMDRFSWPLTDQGADQADFSTVLNVSQIKLSSEGVLHEILDMAGIGDEPLTLKQSEITCNGAQGRISCSPLKILVADSEMTLSGSIGFDGSLDYLLEVPVTAQLVGREGYRILKGTTLNVPIRGSSDQAVFDDKALSAAISDLLGQAAGKVIDKQVDRILPGLLDGILGK